MAIKINSTNSTEYKGVKTVELQDLYNLMKDNFADVKERAAETTNRFEARFSEIITRLDGIDERLRHVETDVAELRGRKLGISVARDWIVGLSAVCALVISLIALLKG